MTRIIFRDLSIGPVHIPGYFKKQLSPEEKEEFLREAQLYYDGISPLSIPRKLLWQYSVKYNESYLKEQYYLIPFSRPRQLFLFCMPSGICRRVCSRRR